MRRLASPLRGAGATGRRRIRCRAAEVRTPSGVHYAVRAWGNELVTARMRAAFHRANVRADASSCPSRAEALSYSVSVPPRHPLRRGGTTCARLRRGEWSLEQMYNLYVDGSDPLALNWS